MSPRSMRPCSQSQRPTCRAHGPRSRPPPTGSYPTPGWWARHRWPDLPRTFRTSANCYAPQKYIKRWSWEIFWLAQASCSLMILPIAVAIITIPHLWLVITSSPSNLMLYAFLMGIGYGIGGTAFNISIRYIGFSLTYSIAVGLSSILGTIVPPLVRGQAAMILARPGSGWVDR